MSKNGNGEHSVQSFYHIRTPLCKCLQNYFCVSSGFQFYVKVFRNLFEVVTSPLNTIQYRLQIDCIGWLAAVLRSMMLSLRCASPNSPSTKNPSASGPRWEMASVICFSFLPSPVRMIDACYAAHVLKSCSMIRKTRAI